MKRWILNSKRSAFIVEHDFIMATYLADKVIVFDGIPAKEAFCTSPEGLVSGMNKFLKMMDITFRRDPTNFRPRINKLNSQKDQEQKSAGNYFLVECTTEKEEDKEARLAKKAAEGKDGKEAKEGKDGKEGKEGKEGKDGKKKDKKEGKESKDGAAPAKEGKSKKKDKAE